MSIPSFLTTERLEIKPLTLSDEAFIFELVNTEGWITFIGNRNIALHVDARAYIQRILANEDITYWVVQLKESLEPIGLITYIKRDYLEHHDIGFAFLPKFSKKGHAYEAAMAVLNSIVSNHKPSHILATTIPENINSITLLKKIGLVFEKEMTIENKTLHVYGRSTEPSNS